MRPRLPFFGLACAAIFGVLLADRCTLTSPPLFAAFTACGLAALVWPRTWLCLLATLLAFAALHTAGHREHPAREIERVLLAGPQITQVAGVVSSDPVPLPFFSPHQTGTFRLKLDAPYAAVVQTTWAGNP